MFCLKQLCILSFKNWKINTLSSKSIQIEKTKISHFDRTKGDKNQIFRTIAYAHDKSYAHLCNLCGASFQTTIQLVDHNYVVHEGKTYDCHLCEKTYETKSGVKNHIKQVHEGGEKQKSHKCSLCEKSFTNLKRHVTQVHEGKRPFACSLCEQKFGQRSQLKTHIRGKHKGMSLFDDIKVQ